MVNVIETAEDVLEAVIARGLDPVQVVNDVQSEMDQYAALHPEANEHALLLVGAKKLAMIIALPIVVAKR